MNFYKSPSDPKSSRCVRLSDYTNVRRATLKAAHKQFCIELNDSKNVHKTLFFQFDSKEDMRKWAALFRMGVKDKALDMSLADKTGWLAVLGGKKMTKIWKRRWVVAQYSTLYLFKDEASASTGLPKMVIDLSEYTKATVVDSARSGKPHTFHITTSQPTATTHFLSALSDTDLRDWLNFITPLLQTVHSPDEDVRAEATDDNNFFVAPADAHFSIPSPSRPDFRILPLDHGHFATSWKELLVGHDPEGVETWRIPGWGRVVATSPDQSLLVATCGKVRQWAIFEAVAGEMVGNPVDHSEWLYSLAWLSSSRFIAASSMSSLFLFSVDGRLLKSWTKLKPNGGLVDLSALRKANSLGGGANGRHTLTSLYDNDADEAGYTMQVHCVAALRADLAAVSEPSANAVWIADLQRGSILQTIDFESPLDLTVTREGRTVVLGVDGRRHIGVITIHRHHASRSTAGDRTPSPSSFSRSKSKNRSMTFSMSSSKFNTWSHDKRNAVGQLHSQSSGRGLKSNSETLTLGVRPSTHAGEGEREPKKSSEVLKLALPGGAGVRIPGNDTILCWKPLVHVSPSHRHLLVNDRTGLLWLYNISSLSTNATGNTTITTNPPRHLGRSILGYVQDVLWLSDDAFLAITNLRTLFKVDLLLDAVVFSRCIL
jgi:hypothetical protein